jgi:phosphonate transport system substrate-binding protein
MTRTILKTAALTSAALLAALGLTGCGSSADTTPDPAAAGTSAETTEWPDPFVVAIIPSEDRTELVPDDSLMLRMLEEELGLHIEYYTATSYAATIEAQRAGKAQMAEYGPFSYVIAKDSGVDLVPLATPAASPDAQTGYYSVASVRADSDIASLEDVQGKTVCFVDPASTSGYLFPTAGLMAAGIDPEKDITPIFTGGHDASVLALADGQCDIAFSTEDMATKQLIESGQLAQGALEQIWKSELIPSSPIALSGSLPDDLIEQITDIFVNDLNVDALKASGDCDETAEDGFCGLDGYWGFVPVDDSVYDGVRAVCDVTEAEACTAVG